MRHDRSPPPRLCPMTTDQNGAPGPSFTKVESLRPSETRGCWDGDGTFFPAQHLSWPMSPNWEPATRCSNPGDCQADVDSRGTCIDGTLTAASTKTNKPYAVLEISQTNSRVQVQNSKFLSTVPGALSLSFRRTREPPSCLCELCSAIPRGLSRTQYPTEPAHI